MSDIFNSRGNAGKTSPSKNSKNLTALRENESDALKKLIQSGTGLGDWLSSNLAIEAEKKRIESEKKGGK